MLTNTIFESLEIKSFPIKLGNGYSTELERLKINLSPASLREEIITV